MTPRVPSSASNRLTLGNLGSLRSALIVSHPGHELRVHGWLELARPVVMMLTNGAGSSGQGRLDSSRRLLERAGASWTSPFGRFTDAGYYQAIIDRDFGLFCGLAEELAAKLVQAGVDYVVGDGLEGFNPGHDVCRLLVDTAVALAARRCQHDLVSYDFLLEGRPEHCPEELRGRALWLRLGPAELARKWAAATHYVELAPEVERVVGNMGLAAFATECLRPVRPFVMALPGRQAPFYETYGKRRVAAGRYRQVLLFDDHVRPLARALRRYATEEAACLV